MDIKTYIDTKKLSIGEVAKQWGFTYGTIKKYYEKDSNPHVYNARKIEELTEGQITFLEARENTNKENLMQKT